MMVITYRDNMASNTRETVWHVGEKLKLPVNVEVSDVLEVQADGDELLQIIFEVPAGLPIAYRSGGSTSIIKAVQLWYGAHAQFIVGNVVQAS